MSTRPVTSSGQRAQQERSRGFTIIELLLVVAIIGMLSTIILTSLSSARDKARYQTAFSSAKGVQAAANICLTEGTTICMPGQSTAGCNASATLDTQDGGAAFVCTTRPATYVMLPAGWVWCDSIGGTGTCSTGSTASSQTTGVSFFLRLKRTVDNVVITCTETGCSCAGAAGLCPNY